MMLNFKGTLEPFKEIIGDNFNTITDRHVVSRIHQKDASLWKEEEPHKKIIKNSLGWLRLPYDMKKNIEFIDKFVEEVRAAGFTHLVLLGMGGSSLAPEVFRTSFPEKEGFLKGIVLDSTSPDAVKWVENNVDLKKTLFIVSSKSGSTIEPLSFFEYYYDIVKKTGNDTPGDQFTAITDPGSSLEQLAKSLKFRKCFLNPSDIGGRFSALSFFGLVPAALMGIDIRELLSSAEKIAEDCRDDNIEKNPGAWLGGVIAGLYSTGRDKLTFIVSEEISELGLWLEQLIAESTGKEGKGIVPITNEPALKPEEYGTDRLFICLELNSGNNGTTEALVSAGHPVLCYKLNSLFDISKEMYRWEFATSVLGALMEINPFDQPDVQAAKDCTKNILKATEEKGVLIEKDYQIENEHCSIRVSENLLKDKPDLEQRVIYEIISGIKDDDYVVILAYFSPFDNISSSIRNLAGEIHTIKPNAIQTGIGPRYLHSTGQLHKGGKNNAVIIILVKEEKELNIPGKSYGFTGLIAAQAHGDFEALSSRGRRAVLVKLHGDPAKSLSSCTGISKYVK